jgi:hypothetical protein
MSEADPSPSLPPNSARDRLRDLLQRKLTCPGHFAGGSSLPGSNPLPLISFRRNATSRRVETLRLPVEAGSRQHDALVEASQLSNR